MHALRDNEKGPEDSVIPILSCQFRHDHGPLSFLGSLLGFRSSYVALVISQVLVVVIVLDNMAKLI